MLFFHAAFLDVTFSRSAQAGPAISIDSILRTIGALACIYTFGLLVTLTSPAALNAVAHEPNAYCVDGPCAMAAYHHATPSAAYDDRYSRVIRTAALFLAGE
jgi:hypothetical protein